MNWNFLQCLDSQALGAQVRTFECMISGESQNQQFAFGPPAAGEGRDLLWRPGRSARQGVHSRGGHDGSGCVAPTQTVVTGAQLLPFQDGCSVDVISSQTPRHGGLEFRLRASASAVGPSGGICAAALGAEGAEATSGLKLAFVACDEADEQQIFHGVKMHGGLQVQVGGACLDTAGGTALLVYPCYDEGQHNMNQILHVEHDKLVWRKGHGGGQFCAASAPVSRGGGDDAAGVHDTTFAVVTCAPKEGQVFLREQKRGDGSFTLRDRRSQQCLGEHNVRSGHGTRLGMVACDKTQFWKELEATHQIQHIGSGLCLDSGSSPNQIGLYACHKRNAGKSQMFEYVSEPGWLRHIGTWGDNGRKRWFEKCLDYKAITPLGLSVQECARTRTRGIRWEKHNEHIPTERRIWNAADKPPVGHDILGGDMLPP